MRKGSQKPPEDGNAQQARGRVNYLVTIGELPRPNDLPCADCGRVWAPGMSRSEYDHYLGYDAIHHEHVEAVCSSCHHRRETDRRGTTRPPRLGPREHAVASASHQLGITVREYLSRVDNGEKWCVGCKAWHQRSRFGIDRARGDGLRPSCRAFRLGEKRRYKERRVMRDSGHPLLTA